MIEISINGKKVKVEKGTRLIEAIEKSGFKVPTLCYAKFLSPYGACRMCVVEIHVPGRRPIVEASCSYPVFQEMEVITDSERVLRARRIVAELLLARCPDSPTIRRIAHEYGIKEPRITKKNEDCILCGLCVRMCEERMGRKAVGFIGRGPKKKLVSPFGRDNPLCWSCGACEFICPVGKRVTELTSSSRLIPIPNEYNKGLNERSAVYILYPQTVPSKPVIDEKSCVHLNYDVCGICAEVCEVKAIDYTQKEEKKEIEVGAILLTPGYQTFDPEIKPEYGYKRLKNVITSIEFERILSPSGPFAGKVLRPSDKKEPKKIAFIQCVGSRDFERDYCSAVCCMYATKEAIVAKEHSGNDLECDIFYMDVRAFGKGFEEYFNKAKSMGVNYIRCRVPKVKENPQTQNPVIEYIDENEKKVSKEYDLVVLSVGIQPPETAKELSEKTGINLNGFGFCQTSPFAPTKTNVAGVYVAGVFTEPKDIPDSVTQGSAAAAEILGILKDSKWELIEKKEYPPERDVWGEEPRIGVFVCHCGTNIASVVNVPEVVEFVKKLPNVVYAENGLYICSTDTQERIKSVINEYQLNRVVVASCTPRTHEPLFRNTLREAGLNPFLFEMANIREHCAWVHYNDKAKATEKAKDLIRMAIAKVRLLEPLVVKYLPIKKSALVVGGGVSGMVSALSLANQGFEVFLVEKEQELGGNLRNIYYLLNGHDPQRFLQDLTSQVKSNENIKVFTNAQIQDVDGSIGNFKTRIISKGDEFEIEHGIVIIATGAKEYKPTEYHYGEDPRVLTQLELEQMIGEKKHIKTNGKVPKNIVMIQCVGSRNDERKYCSRICCSHAIKNAIKIKEIAPETDIFVLYRDIRTYGFREQYYTKARKLGVNFVRYNDDREPEVVERNKDGFVVKVFNPVLNMDIKIPADLIVLSTAVVPDEEENEKTSKLLKVPLTQDKFFLEAHLKLRPVDFATDGVFLAGLAHFPKDISECISQAKAAAAKASIILSQDFIELNPQISYVVDENCDGCAYCVDTCPFNAITLIEYVWKDTIKKTVDNNESICKGCGTCMATCPKKGIYVKGFKLEQIEAQIEAALSGG